MFINASLVSKSLHLEPGKDTFLLKPHSEFAGYWLTDPYLLVYPFFSFSANIRNRKHLKQNSVFRKLHLFSSAG